MTESDTAARHVAQLAAIHRSDVLAAALLASLLRRVSALPEHPSEQLTRRLETLRGQIESMLTGVEEAER